MKRLPLALIAMAASTAGCLAATALQPLIDACALAPCTVTMADGEYDDAAPVYIGKEVTLTGSRDAIVHSEFQIVGTSAHFVGFTLAMNKVGAPARNGYSVGPFPQNGMIVIRNATLWADDMEIRAEPGLTGAALQKNAFHVVQGQLQLRAVTKFSRIDWRNSPWQVIELNYGSYANIFDISGQGVGMNIASSVSVSPTGQGGSAIVVAGSKLTLSGANLFNCRQPAPAACTSAAGLANVFGVNVLRDGYVQVGAGVPTTIQYFTIPGGANNAIVLDPTSRQYIAAGSVVN